MFNKFLILERKEKDKVNIFSKVNCISFGGIKKYGIVLLKFNSFYIIYSK